MKPVIALDIETSGLDAWRDQIYMCGLYDGTKYTCVRDGETLRELLFNDYANFDIVGHRTDFDIKFLLVQGWIKEIDLKGRIIHDTRIIGSLLKKRVPKEYLDYYELQRKELNKTLPNGTKHREGSPLSLKVMAPWYLKVPPFWETPGDHNNPEYNERDDLYTYGLFQLLAPRLQAEGSWEFYLEKMLPWTAMLRRMEMRGINISEAELDLVEQEYLAKREALKIKLDDLWWHHHEAYRQTELQNLTTQYGEMCSARLLKSKDPEKTKKRYQELFMKAACKVEKKINFSSPVQMAWLLKERLELDITDMDGEESTGKAVLHKLASEGREDIKTFLDWREADKVLTMYVPTYRNLHVDGVIHPSFNLTGTRTGRTSSSAPNLQQVPSKLYRLFLPRTGNKFVKYDLSGIEAALIALYSGDIQLYGILEQGESIHDHNAKAMFNLSCEIAEVSTLFPRERKTVKNIGFACFYGAGWRRISKVFAAGGFPISDAEAKKKLELLKSYYPKVFAFHKEITEVFETGETVINLLGRPVTMQPHENPYMQGFNSLIQSSASDLNLDACYKFEQHMQGWGAGPLLVIHDCVLAEADSAQTEETSEALKRHMTNYNLRSINGPIQLRVEGGISNAWE